jgi:hypothetical protein
MKGSVKVVVVAGAFLLGSVFGPAASQAAGTLMTLVDSATNTPAQVTSRGALRVVPQPDSVFTLNQNFLTSGAAGTSWQQRYSPWAGASKQVGITHMTAANVSSAPTRVTLELRKRISGTATCANPTTGFATYVVRTVVVPANNTVEVDLSSAPAYSAGSSTELTCLTYKVYATSAWALYLGVSGFAV